MGRKPVLIVDGQKRCSKCGESKLVDQFYAVPIHKAACGLSNQCRQCIRDYKRPRPQQRTKQQAAARRSKEYKSLRSQVLAAYGGQCACCGESTPEFLSIDHIYNDGAAERKRTGAGYPFYVKLRQQGFPRDRYQVLCYNCNYAKSRYGACPHLNGKDVPPNLRGVYRFADGVQHVNGVVM